MEKELLYWVFSTIVQGFVALLALVGMVGIYKISKLNDLFDRLLRSRNMETILDSYGESNFLVKHIEQTDIIDNIANIIARHKESSSIYDLRVTYPRLRSTNEEIQHFKRSFKSFALITIIVITVSLILLGLTPYIAKAPHGIIIIIVIGVIGLSLWSLIEAFRLIKRAIMPEKLKKGKLNT